MSRPSIECKKLAMKLRANEDNYVTGQWDLNEALDETERLYNQVKGKSGDDGITANEIMPDSDLMKLQTRLAKRSAKNYKPDSLVFNPVEFANKLKFFYDQSNASQSDSRSLDESIRNGDMLWLQLGNAARKLLYTVPSFTFIHGTFDPDPVEVVKKRRKMKERDKLGKATKPESMSMTENTDNQDMMIREAERVLGILKKLIKKTDENVICFYEFVTDPTSFGRTIENIFIVSLLVKEGCVRIVSDRNNLPCLLEVPDEERRDRNTNDIEQCIMTIGHEEWKNIVRTFKLEKSIIPPRKNAARLNGTR